MEGLYSNMPGSSLNKTMKAGVRSQCAALLGAANLLFSIVCWYEPSIKAFAPPSFHGLAAGTEEAFYEDQALSATPSCLALRQLPAASCLMT